MQEFNDQPASTSGADLSTIHLEPGYEKAWLVDENTLLLQAKQRAVIYDIATKKVKHILKDVITPIADYLMHSQEVLLTRNRLGTVQIWKISAAVDSSQDLPCQVVDVSRFKLLSLSKHSDNHFIATDILNNLSIWCVDTQEKIFEYKFPFNIIHVRTLDSNTLMLIGMDATCYKKLKFTIDEQRSELLWETNVNGIVSNLENLRTIEETNDSMTIVRKKVYPSEDPDHILWLERKSKEGERPLLRVKPEQDVHDEVGDQAECSVTISRDMPRACFFFPRKNVAYIKQLHINDTSLSISL